MKTLNKIYCSTLIAVACTLFQGCARNGNDVWEDTKTAGRHLKRGFGAIAGSNAESRQIRSKDEFDYIEDGEGYAQNGFQEDQWQEFQDGSGASSMMSSDFIPLEDQANNTYARPPRETPGEPGSSIPGIEYFRDPSTIPQLAPIFQTILFDYDSSLIKGQQNLQIIRNIADYLRSHPNVYVFIEGHTCERGPQAYNLALGSRRSNIVRNSLIDQGVNPDQLFTVTYGKERPCVMEGHEEALAKNRRAEFRIYVR